MYYWVIIACCCGMIITSLGISNNCSGVFFAPIANDLGVGIGDTAMYITIMNLVTGFMGPLVILLSQKWYIRTTIFTGMLLTVLSMLSWSYITSVWPFYIAAVVHGVGNAMLGAVVINMIIGNWFYQSVGMVMGAVLSFSGITGAILSPVLQSAIESWGWRNAHLIATAIAFVCVLPATVFVQLRPQNKGLLPYGYSATASENGEKDAREATKNEADAPKLALVLIICIVSFITAFITGMGQHMSNYALNIGIDVSTGVLLISAVMVGNMSSKLLLGIFSDVIGTKPALLLFIILSALGLLVLGAFENAGFWVLIIAAVCLGFSYSLSGLGMAQVTRSIFASGASNKVYAYATTVALVASSLSYSLIGYSYDLLHSYRFVCLFCAAMTVVSVLLLLRLFRTSETKGSIASPGSECEVK